MPSPIGAPDFTNTFAMSLARRAAEANAIKASLMDGLASIDPSDPTATTAVTVGGQTIQMSKEEIQAMLQNVNDYLKILQNINEEEAKYRKAELDAMHRNILAPWQ